MMMNQSRVTDAKLTELRKEMDSQLKAQSGSTDQNMSDHKNELRTDVIKLVDAQRIQLTNKLEADLQTNRDERRIELQAQEEARKVAVKELQDQISDLGSKISKLTSYTNGALGQLA